MNVEKFKIGKKVKDTAGDVLTYIGPSKELPGYFIFEIGSARHLYNEFGMPVTLYADELVEPEINSLDEYFEQNEYLGLLDGYAFYGIDPVTKEEKILMFMQVIPFEYTLFCLGECNRRMDKKIHASAHRLSRKNLEEHYPELFQCQMFKADFTKLIPNV